MTRFYSGKLLFLKHLFERIQHQISTYSTSNIFRTSLRNSAWNTGEYILLGIFWLALTPFFVNRLGVDRYGIWMLANSLIGIMSIMGVGLKEATIKCISSHLANNNINGIMRVVRSTLTIQGILGFPLIIVAYFAPPLIVSHVINIKLEDVHLAIIAIRIVCLGRAVGFFDSVFISVLQGYQRHDLNAKVVMVANIITLLVNFGLVLLGYGVAEMLSATIVIMALSGVAKAFVVWRILLPSLHLYPLFEMSVLKELFGFGIYSWIQEIGNLLFNHADRLIIASFLDSSALTYYAVCSQLAQQIYAILNHGVSFLFPFSSTIQEKGNLALMRIVYFKATNFVVIASIGLSIPLFLFAFNILLLWMGIGFANEATNVLRVLTVVYSLLATSIVPYHFMNGTGFVRMNSVCCFLRGIVVGLFTVCLVPSFGIIGAASGRLFSILIDVIGRTGFHYKGLADQCWYAGLRAIVPVLLVFLGAIIVLAKVGPIVLNLLVLWPLMSTTSLIGMILVSALMRLFNKEKADFKGLDII